MEYMPDFRLLHPTTLDQALSAFADNPDARYLAGGTDIMVNVRRGIVDAPVMIDLTGIDQLNTVSDLPDGGLRIGAGITLSVLAENSHLRQHFPAMVTAALDVAASTHRAVATLGGNLCLDTRCVFYNQSEWWRAANDYCLKYGGDTCHVAPSGKTCFAAFSGDVAPSILIYGGAVEITGKGGQRIVPLGDIYCDDGLAHLSIAKGDILSAVILPAPQPGCSDYAKARVRGAIDFPLAGIAARLSRDGDTLEDISLALTGVSARPFLLQGTENITAKVFDTAALEQLLDLIPKQIQPMTSTFTPPGYRRKVIANMTRDLISRLWEKA